MNIRYVPCTFSVGMFDGEVYVNLGSSSAIVDKEQVRIEAEPRQQLEGRGSVRVFVVQEQPDSILVEISGQPVVGSLRTWIPNLAVAV